MCSKPFVEDPHVFKKLSGLALPTLNIIPKSCRRGLSKCYVETVRKDNECPIDVNHWEVMQTFMVSVLRSIANVDKSKVSLAVMVVQRLAV